MNEVLLYGPEGEKLDLHPRRQVPRLVAILWCVIVLNMACIAHFAYREASRPEHGALEIMAAPCPAVPEPVSGQI